MEAVSSALDKGEKKQPALKQATAHQQPLYVYAIRWAGGMTSRKDYRNGLSRKGLEWQE